MTYSPETYFRALAFAAKAHGAQQTPHGLPYVVHISSVAAELIWALSHESGRDQDFAVACALLHDVIRGHRSRRKSRQKGVRTEGRARRQCAVQGRDASP